MHEQQSAEQHSCGDNSVVWLIKLNNDSVSI